MQKQLSELEKGHVKDRQELTEKIAAQKKEFDAEIKELRKKNTQVCVPRPNCLTVGDTFDDQSESLDHIVLSSRDLPSSLSTS